MNVTIEGAPEAFSHALEHIVRLYAEEPRIEFRPADAPRESAAQPEPQAEHVPGEEAWRIRFDWAADADGRPTVAATLLAGARSYVAEEPIREAGEDEAGKRGRRMAASRALVRALGEATGMEQPWGILTGVRPTKLLHQQRQAGVPDEAALAGIREETLADIRKLRLLQTIVDRQQDALPDLYRLKNGVSLYIGIPFCPTKCAYCTFPAYAIGGRQGSVDGFLDGLRHEMRETGRWLKAHGVPITTIYYGGGTPTSITAEEMDALYAEMAEHFPMDGVREITVEAGRPDTITPEKLRVLRKWGIDRISINPQSYTQATLDKIGRHHTVEETVNKFRLAREMGMANINMDLIIGLPGEGVEAFRHTLDRTAELMPESLTVHTLSFKRASEMTRNKEAYDVAGRDEVQAMMRMAEEWTDANGYAPYYLYRQKNILGNLENVGYAKPGRESLYNILIMEELQTIVGLGCGASSKWVDPAGGISRYANPKEPKAYNETYRTHTAAKLEALARLFDAAPKQAFAGM